MRRESREAKLANKSYINPQPGEEALRAPHPYAATAKKEQKHVATPLHLRTA
jgi:hypothetical protein